MNFEKILIIRPSGVGDVLWTTPFLRNLKKGLPQARVHYLVKESCAPVLENNSDVDRLIIYKGGCLKEQIGFLRQLRGLGCDLCLDLVGTPRTAIQSLFSGARVRLGFDFGYRRFFYNKVLSAREANQGHEVEFNLYVLNYLGIEIKEKELIFNLTPEEISFRQKYWQDRGWEGRRVIGIIPTGGWACKKWPSRNYIALGRAFANEKDLSFLVFWGTQAEEKEAGEIAQGIGSQAALAPRTTLRQMAALLSGCRAVVGNDTGPLHMATAFGVPVVSFYGPTSPSAQGPWGRGHRVLRDESLSCLVCNRTQCRDPICMRGIRPEKAVQALKDVLATWKE